MEGTDAAGTSILKADAVKRGLSWETYCHDFGIDDSRGSYNRKLHESAIGTLPRSVASALGDLMFANYQGE